MLIFSLDWSCRRVVYRRDGLAGYLNRTELTQERFIPNPFSSKPEARLYTGDLARYLSDNIEFF